MSNINRAIVAGRLTRDSELSYLGTGSAVLKFSIAVGEYMGKDREEYTNFFDCEMFGKRGEALAQYLPKGKQVTIDATLHQSRWDSDAGKRSKIILKVSAIELSPRESSQSSSPQPRPTAPGNIEEFEDEEIPF